MKLKILLFVVLLLPMALGAEIYGTAYDLSLDPQQNVVIVIDTVPEQTLIAPDGAYSFDLSPGKYRIRAEYREDGIVLARAEEDVEVVGEGKFRVDLILLDVTEEELFEDTDFEVVDEYNGFGFPWLGGLVVLFAILLVPYPLYRFFKARKTEAEEEISDLVSEDLEKVLKILKEEGGRTTQKHIRKKLGLSEAKVSLMITELEHKNLVVRIKKGRGNVIAFAERSSA